MCELLRLGTAFLASLMRAGLLMKLSTSSRVGTAKWPPSRRHSSVAVALAKAAVVS